MRHNKIIGWENFLGLVEKVHQVSPWLSRQIAKRAKEWPFWVSGAKVEEWGGRQVWVHQPVSFRNAVEGEICHGHLLLAAELTLRLLLLRFREEFPFRYQVRSSAQENHHAVNQAIDYKFEISFKEWERIRLELARESYAEAEFVFPSRLADGRLAATYTFKVLFQSEKLLPGAV